MSTSKDQRQNTEASQVESSVLLGQQTIRSSFSGESHRGEVLYAVKSPLLYQPFDSLERVFSRLMNGCSNLARKLRCPRLANKINDLRFNVFRWCFAHLCP